MAAQFPSMFPGIPGPIPYGAKRAAHDPAGITILPRAAAAGDYGPPQPTPLALTNGTVGTQDSLAETAGSTTPTAEAAGPGSAGDALAVLEAEMATAAAGAAAAAKEKAKAKAQEKAEEKAKGKGKGTGKG
eukprot:7424418-Pyramimonas_sp.AAC.1